MIRKITKSVLLAPVNIVKGVMDAIETTVDDPKVKR